MVSLTASFARHSCLVTVLLLFPQCLYGQANTGTDLVLLTPLPGKVAVSKTPKIVIRSNVALHKEGQLFLLDGNDVTALVTVENNSFTYTPIEPLRSGKHSVYVGAYSADGAPIEKEFFFTSRQSESFEEIYSNNHVSATVKTILKQNLSLKEESFGSSADSSDSPGSPYTTFDSYLSSDSAAREGKWATSVKVNTKYYDQNAALAEPEKKGVGLLDFLIAANYSGEKSSVHTEIGDTTIEESTNTVDYLTHRGGQASISIGNFTLGGFGVRATESGYELDSLGFRLNSSDYIIGTSAKMTFFDKQMSLKGIYASGGEQEDSMGSWSETGGRKGDVTGIVFSSDFFNQLLVTDIEFDTVNYDSDTDDDDGTTYDKAYRLQISGLGEIYDYKLSYKYTGPRYEVVENQSIVRDWAGFDFNSGLTWPSQAIRLLANYSWDNVEDEELYPRVYSFTAGLDYQYSGWEKFPLSLVFEHSRQDSKDEPPETNATSLETSTVTATVGYLNTPWAVEFTSSFSDQNDKTEFDNDTRLFSFSVAPSYTYAFFSIMSSWSLNSSTDLLADVRTDANTLTLDINSSFLNNTVSCECGGTYDWVKAEDDSVDTNTAALYARLNYHFERLGWLEDSTIALEYNYDRQEDEIYDSIRLENILTLVLSTAIPYSF